MHLPPNHKPPGVSHKLRFQSTAQSAMHATGEQYANLEPYSERVQRLRERKMKNVTTSINFGFHQAPYETTMRSNDEYDRSVVLKPAGMDDDKILTPHEMKQKLSSSNWTFGDHGRDFGRASTFADPTGPGFLSYKGVLNGDVRDAIKSSSLHFGSEKASYETAQVAGLKMAANDMDYEGDLVKAKALKKSLQRSCLDFSTGEPFGLDDYESTARVSMRYDPVGARTAAGVLDAAMQKDLRASHFQLSHVKEPFPETCAKEGMRKAERAVEERRQKIANSEECRQTGLHPDVMMMQKDRKFAKELKDMLLSNSVVVGDDENYM
mmetsp:Transcript_5220/g.12205  ORF Transcript_5220/g.12205 Transcript_5220/m.12205 type:complete len:323 (-) Transcript_5220:276-1244(-)